MATLTVRPASGTGGGTADASVNHLSLAGDTWANIQGGAGTGASASAANDYAFQLLTEIASPKWGKISRYVFTFDTSSLTASATISSAVLSVYGRDKADPQSWAPNMNVYSSNPATVDNIAAGDYDSLGTTEFSTSKAYADLATTNWNDFTLNASGISAISKTGITKLGLRNANYDVANSTPTWAALKDSYFTIDTADQGGTATDPVIVITYTTSSLKDPIMSSGIIPFAR